MLFIKLGRQTTQLWHHQHAMTNPNRSRDAKKDGEGDPQTDDTEAADPEVALQ